MPLTLISLQATLREMSLRQFFHVQDIRDMQTELGALADALETPPSTPLAADVTAALMRSYPCRMEDEDPRDAHGHRIYGCRHASED